MKVGERTLSSNVVYKGGGGVKGFNPRRPKRQGQPPGKLK